MKIGLLSDIHANFHALQAVLDELEKREIEKIIHAGDIVGYNPNPDRVINELRKRDILSVQGNHDAVTANETAIEKKSELMEKSSEWTRGQLDAEEISYLRDLPKERLIEIENTELRIVHGSPRERDEYIYPEDITQELVDTEDILVYGHTHYPVVASVPSGLIINPGSVGQPRDGDPAASFAILDTNTLSVNLQRVSYPIETVKQEIIDESLPTKFAKQLE